MAPSRYANWLDPRGDEALRREIEESQARLFGGMLPAHERTRFSAPSPTPNPTQRYFNEQGEYRGFWPLLLEGGAAGLGALAGTVGGVVGEVAPTVLGPGARFGAAGTGGPMPPTRIGQRLPGSEFDPLQSAAVAAEAARYQGYSEPGSDPGVDAGALLQAPDAASTASALLAGMTRVKDPDTGDTILYYNGQMVGFVPLGGKEAIWTDPAFAALMAQAGVAGRPATGGSGGGAPQPWGQTEAGARFAAEQATLADERATTWAREKTKIEQDTTLSVADKEIAKQRLIEQGKQDLQEAELGFGRWKAELERDEAQLDRAARAAEVAGNLQLQREILSSQEKVAAAKAQVDREIAALGAYGTLLGVESQERGRKAEAAASVFRTLAELAPQDQLRSAFYLLRGQAPPPALGSNLPAGLLSALGVNQDTTRAAAEQLRGAISVPPFLQKLMGS